jgi:hypothetical protein
MNSGCMRSVGKASGIGGIHGIGGIELLFCSSFGGNRGRIKEFGCNCAVKNRCHFF